MLSPSALFRVLQERPCQAQPHLAISFVQQERGPAAAGQSFARTAVGFKLHQQKENLPEETQLLLAS
jgi:hypothetical protein